MAQSFPPLAGLGFRDKLNNESAEADKARQIARSVPARG
jgi:hypothetical protein